MNKLIVVLKGMYFNHFPRGVIRGLAKSLQDSSVVTENEEVEARSEGENFKVGKRRERE